MKGFATTGVLLIACLSLTAQSRLPGVVMDSLTNERIPFVHIRVEGKEQVTVTDREGKFSIRAADTDTLRFTYVGYRPKAVPVAQLAGQQEATVVLARSEIGLDAVEVFAGENPAHRIIRLAADNRDANNPRSLEQFAYTAYEKFVVSAYRQKDSAMVIRDSIGGDELSQIKDSAQYARPPDTVKTSEDSARTWPDSIDPLDSTNLFLMETVTRRIFSGEQKDKSTVVASRVSGFKRMDYLLLANQMQPFGFDEDRVQLFGLHYLNPISKGSASRYFFNLRDTIYQGRDSIFVISFHPFKGKDFKGLKGVLYINSDGYALQNIVAEPSEQSANVIRLQQQYAQHGGKWFPVVQKLDFILSAFVVNHRKGWISSRRRISEIDTDPEVSRRDLRGFDVEVDKKAYDRPDSVWAVFRPNPLTRKEQNTYKLIDSLGEAENFDTKLRWLKAMVTGKLRTGTVDWKLRELLAFNRYEVFRLGAGLETNENLLRPLRIGGHLAYGFGDEHWKYGVYGKWIIDPVQNLSLKVGYQNDVFHSGGRPGFYGHRWSTVWDGDLYPVYVSDMFHKESLEASFEFRLWSDLTGRLTGGQARYWQPLDDYQLEVGRGLGVQVVQDHFVGNFASLQLRYAYGEEHIRLLNEVISLGTDYPVFHLNLTRGLGEPGAANLVYNKAEALVTYSHLFRKMGRTKLTLSGGWMDAGTPYYLQYFMAGSNVKDNYTAYSNAFNTMPFQQFLAERYAMLNVDHNFGNIFGKNDFMEPSLHVELASGFGWNRVPEVHGNVEITPFRGGYHEVGLSLRDIYVARSSGQFGSGLGLGFYYRMGPYNTDKFEEDFAVKLTLSFSRPDF